MRIRLRERDQQTRRWHTVLDQRVSVTSCTRVVPLALNESSELSLFLYPEPGDGWRMHFDARILIGNFPVASTLERDPPDFTLRLASEGEEGADYFVCSGRLLRDWVGETELRVEVLDRNALPPTPEPAPDEEADDPFLQRATDNEQQPVEHWTPVLASALHISAGTIEQEAFEALSAEIADYPT